MSSLQISSFACECYEPKTHSLLFDGGQKFKEYRLICCDKCYETEDKRFLLAEENL